MPKPAKAQTHTVNITVKNGDFSYDNPLFYAYRGDTILWKCTNNYHFAVHLGWNSPMPKGRYRAKPGKEIKDKIKSDADHGDYKYFVAVYDGNDNVWTDDPRFIVRK